MVVPTRNRGERILPTIRSILANNFEPFELLVVDQSEEPGVAELKDPRLKVLSRPGQGISRAKNIALASARYSAAVFTDDDCIVPKDWLTTAASSLRGSADLVFGNVHPGPHDPNRQFVLHYVKSVAGEAGSLIEKHRVQGLGACMAVRRDVWEALGGFDEMLGLAAPFGSGEEVDLTLRALLKGFKVAHRPEFAVTHHGPREIGEQAALVVDYLYGTGAVYGKLLKRGYLSILPHLAILGVQFALGRSGVSFGPRPRRYERWKGFMGGLWAGVTQGVSGADLFTAYEAIGSQRSCAAADYNASND